MRIILPLALTLATLAGCGRAPDRTEETALRPPVRDLTLQATERPAATVASAVELDRSPPVTAARPTVRRPARHPKPAPPLRPAQLAHVPAVPPTVQPVPLAIPARLPVKTAAASDPYALEPGETVTVLPASGTPSPGGPVDLIGDRPADARGTDIQVGGRGGGSCGGRGGGHHPGGFRDRH